MPKAKRKLRYREKADRLIRRRSLVVEDFLTYKYPTRKQHQVIQSHKTAMILQKLLPQNPRPHLEEAHVTGPHEAAAVIRRVMEPFEPIRRFGATEMAKRCNEVFSFTERRHINWEFSRRDLQAKIAFKMETEDPKEDYTKLFGSKTFKMKHGEEMPDKSITMDEFESGELFCPPERVVGILRLVYSDGSRTGPIVLKEMGFYAWELDRPPLKQLTASPITAARLPQRTSAAPQKDGHSPTDTQRPPRPHRTMKEPALDHLELAAAAAPAPIGDPTTATATSSPKASLKAVPPPLVAASPSVAVVPSITETRSVGELLHDRVFGPSGDPEAAEGDAFFVGDMGEVARQHIRWKAKLPRIEPFYAVKCNPDAHVVQTLADLGVGFDCASKAEIQQILDHGVSASRIIYANPCKQSSHLRHAASRGVRLMTFDNADELRKIKVHVPDAQLVVRILTDDSRSVCKLGLKFGAPLETVGMLLGTAKELGLDVVGVR
ncbi:hypothetical protein HDU96_001030 [Phlyctochytrium bullatum]|nr:hypothetical protein HDU96_001030 [Phlyctochytrium bullatum]